MERTTSIVRSVCVTEMVQRGVAVAGVSAQPPPVGAPARVETEGVIGAVRDIGDGQ